MLCYEQCNASDLSEFGWCLRPFCLFSYGNTVFTGWQDLMPYAILNTEIYGFRKECCPVRKGILGQKIA